jgi:hypothetical protein
MSEEQEAGTALEAVGGGAVGSLVQNPFDLPIDVFRAGLERRSANRKAFLEWIKSHLVVGIDYGKIHVVGKAKCGLGNTCLIPEHYSKDCLFLPGAENILGNLGLTDDYPNLNQYEKMAIDGKHISLVVLRCEIKDNEGRVVSKGIGARTLDQDYGDINKTLKMAKKSAKLDATKSVGGLSELFTIDLEDAPSEEELEVLRSAARSRTAASSPPPPPTPHPTAPSNGGRVVTEKQAKAIWAILFDHLSKIEALKGRGSNEFINEFAHWYFKVGSLKELPADMVGGFITTFSYGKNRPTLEAEVMKYLAQGPA